MFPPRWSAAKSLFPLPTCPTHYPTHVHNPLTSAGFETLNPARSTDSTLKLLVSTLSRACWAASRAAKRRGHARWVLGSAPKRRPSSSAVLTALFLWPLDQVASTFCCLQSRHAHSRKPFDASWPCCALTSSARRSLFPPPTRPAGDQTQWKVEPLNLEDEAKLQTPQIWARRPDARTHAS